MSSQRYSDAPLAFLQDLGTPEAPGNGEPATQQRESRPIANAHIHLPPNFSAFDSIDEVIELASEQNIAVLGTSNYYDYSAYTSFSEKALAVGVFPMFGIEVVVKLDELVEKGININDPGVPGKIYFCGKGITKFLNIPEPAKSTLSTIRKGDAENIADQIAIIASLFAENGLDTRLDPSSTKEHVPMRHGCSSETVYLQERHVAQAFQQALFKLLEHHDQRFAALNAILDTPIDCSLSDEVTVQGLVRTQLMKAGKPAYAEASIIDLVHGYEMILAMGGIPCYPVLIEGARYRGCYRERGDNKAIALGVQNVSVFLHELMHAADYCLGNAAEKGQHWRKETVAEFGAAILAECLGLESEKDIDGAYRCIEQYAKAAEQGVQATCMECLDLICEAVNLILETAEELNRNALTVA